MTLMQRRRALMGVNKMANELSGDWGRIYIERVTIGDNSVTNTYAAANLIADERSDKTGVVFAIRRVNTDSPAPTGNEFGGLMTSNGYRYRNGAWDSTSIAYAYDGVISSGSVFDVFSMKYNSL